MSKHSVPHHNPGSSQTFRPARVPTGPMVEAWLHSGEAYAQACLACQQEVLRFLGSRLQWDSRVTEAFAKCKTLSEVADVQRSWAMETAQEYFDEATRLTQLAAKCVPSWIPGMPHKSEPQATSEPVAHAAE